MPDDPKMSSLFENYDPVGAVGGMFAPAYIHGFAPSEQAVAAWNAENRNFTAADIDATRMPPEWAPPSQTAGQLGGGMRSVYGGGDIPMNQRYGDPRGPVDPEALRVAAQGGKYDKAARRDAIAQRVAANTAAAANYNAAQARSGALAMQNPAQANIGFMGDPNYYLLAAGG